MTSLNEFAVHDQNQILANTIIEIAQDQNLNTRRNVTNINSRDGYHRYVILRTNKGISFSINSKACVAFTEARFSKWHTPSIIGEQRALIELLHILTK